MPYKEKVIEKSYFTIGEVAEMFAVSTSLIRFWEQEFDILQPKKNKKGNRLFTRKDLDNLKIIYHLVKERGYTLKGAREKLKGNQEQLDRELQIVASLQRLKHFLHELKSDMDHETFAEEPLQSSLPQQS
jgi:DNA-binding transcriptional MerR regulator